MCVWGGRTEEGILVLGAGIADKISEGGWMIEIESSYSLWRETAEISSRVGSNGLSFRFD